jgi:hypothetical protein
LAVGLPQKKAEQGLKGLVTLAAALGVFFLVLGGCATPPDRNRSRVTPTVVSADQPRVEAIRSTMLERIRASGQTPPWYEHLKELRVNSETVVAYTGYFDSELGREQAHGICQAIAEVVDAPDTAAPGIRRIVIMTADSIALATRESPGQPC